MANLFLTNANIIPVPGSSGRAGALLSVDGRVAAVGSHVEVRAVAPPSVEVLDLAGAMVVPGFVDSHVHPLLTGLQCLHPPLVDAKNVAEYCRGVGERAATAPAGKWILGVGCPVTRLHEHRLPTASELDAVAPQNPVYVSSQTVHAGAANTCGLQRIRPDSSWSGLGRDADGALLGTFESDDSHRAAMRRVLSDLTDAEIAEAYQAAARLAVSKGLTTIHCLEGQFVTDDRDVRVLASTQHSLPLHSLLYFQTLDVNKALAMGLPRVGGCLTIDGASFEHTALLYSPYADRPDTTGQLNIAETEVVRFVDEAHSAGLQVAMHAIGDRAIDILVAAYKAAMAKTPRRDCRHRVEHFMMPTSRARADAARLGLALVMQPVSTLLWDQPGASEYERVLGAQRAAAAEPFAELLSLGLNIVGSSDSPVADLDPLLGIRALVQNPRESRNCSLDQALRLFTSAGAWAGFEEAERGTLEIGKAADMTVLSGDLFDDLEGAAVVMTIVNGEVVWAA